MRDAGSFTLSNAIREAAHPLTGAVTDYDPLMRLVDDARFVLLGEASHGTHEFYGERAQITKRLIKEKGFTAVAVEADWPDAYRVNRYVRGVRGETEAVDALSGFKRFPTWMWRNADVLDFVGWLRARNDALSSDQKVGFYGLDLYSLHASMEAVLNYLGEEIGAQVEAEKKPLEGITAELKGGGEDSISIFVGRTPAERVTHNITAPTHVRIEQAENRADMALQIESEGGATTLVRLRSAMLPEMVDGIIAEQ